MTMAITLERYFAVVRPLALFTCKKILGPLTVAFAITWNIPRFFEWEIVTSNVVNGEDSTEFEIHESNFRKGIYYNLYYRMWLTFIIIEAIPYLTIIILNAMILQKIMKSYSFRKSFNERMKIRAGYAGENEEHQLGLITHDLPQRELIRGLICI